jgi:hypothetical protein
MPTIIKVRKKISYKLVGFLRKNTSIILINIKETEVQVAMATVMGIDFIDKERKKMLANPRPK